MPKVLVEDMKKLYEVSKKHYGFNDDWYLFGDTDPITNGKLRCRKNKNCELAEVKQIRIHDFRHSHVSLLINKYLENNLTIDFLTIAKRMGHSVNETMETYAHMYPSAQKNIIDLL